MRNLVRRVHIMLSLLPNAVNSLQMIAVVFPGQGSQKPGMGRELFEVSAAAREVFGTVTQATGIDAPKLCFETDEETLRQTQKAQLALYTCGLAAWRALEEGAKPEVGAMAGHSVGEYAALVAAGALSVEDGARLVQRRGELMAKAGEEQPGTMAAVLGLDREGLEQACAEAGGVVVVANDNCPGQLVISGTREAVAAASRLAAERGAKRVLPLKVSGAFHSPLMEEPAKEFARALESVVFAACSVPVYSNVTSEPMTDMERWPRLLEDQLRSPVRWTESVQAMIRGGTTTFVECGSGEVLSGLIRRIDKEVQTLSVTDRASLKASVEAPER